MMLIKYKDYNLNTDKISSCPICLRKHVVCKMGYNRGCSCYDDDRDTYGYLRCDSCGFMVEDHAYTCEGRRMDIVEDRLAEQWNKFYSKRREKIDIEQSKENKS